MRGSLRLLVYGGALTGPFGGAAVFALVPSLKAAFDATGPQVLATLTAFMLPFALLQLVTGAWADAGARRGALLGGFAVYSAGCALCAAAATFPVFLVGRVLMGSGFAFSTPVLAALLGESTSDGTRGRAFGYFGSALMAGLAAGPLVAGWLARWSWRLAFALLALGGVALWLVAARVVPRAARTATAADALRGTGRALAHALRDGRVWLLCALGAVAFFVIIGATSYLSDWLSLPPRSYSDARIGLVVSAWGFAGIVFSPLAGAWVDGAGRRTTAALGFALSALPLWALRGAASFGEFFLLVLALGGLAALVWTPLLTLSVELQPARRATVASLFNAFRFLGYAAAPVALAPLYGGAGGVRAVFAATAALSLAGMVVVGFLRARP